MFAQPSKKERSHHCGFTCYLYLIIPCCIRPWTHFTKAAVRLCAQQVTLTLARSKGHSSSRSAASARSSSSASRISSMHPCARKRGSARVRARVWVWATGFGLRRGLGSGRANPDHDPYPNAAPGACPSPRLWDWDSVRVSGMVRVRARHACCAWFGLRGLREGQGTGQV